MLSTTTQGRSVANLKSEIMRLYATGIYSTQIAKTLGRTVGQVEYVLSKEGLVRAAEHRLKFRTRSGKGHLLSIHHIDYNKQNCSGINPITLCMQCNPRVNSKRAVWTKHFRSLLVEKIGANYS